ncbi:hypothetical protein NIIDMKKI_41140 [Mycobacterium kansasii]|uniref:UDP-glucose/GDP-mannose dehydrogenase N-terminal domain-containing protein n=1 Tax=Mycobacterium kansasii TaxID=1768 RepID=A0A7G1IJS9_MYCKA|nr:hypothetical protein NIIDMKKI_41140 [Mycobacterium kansasii]
MATQPSERICIVGGAGHVGLPLALVLADEGYTVDILDTNAQALRTIMAGRMPFIENGAEDLLKRLLPTGRICASTDAWVVRNADIVICVVGTPVDEYLTPQAHTFFRIIDEISPYFHDDQTLVLRSTVYPGLSQRVHDMFAERGSAFTSPSVQSGSRRGTRSASCASFLRSSAASTPRAAGWSANSSRESPLRSSKSSRRKPSWPSCSATATAISSSR